MKKKFPTWLKLISELLIVILGVYIAFLLNSYSEGKKEDAEKEKVLIALKKELEKFRVLTPDWANYQKGKVKNWRAAIQKDSIVSFHDWRFLEPQYNYQIIEYALNQQGVNIIDFELHEALSEIYAIIRHLEHAERLMTSTAQEAVFIPHSLPKTSSEYKIQIERNKFYFKKFVNFARDRAGALGYLSEKSVGVLELIDSQFSEEKRKNIETRIISDFIRHKGIENLDEMKDVMKQYFPHFTEPEVERVFSDAQEEESE